MEDRLQKFAQLVDIGSFTKAAEQLHISQPALSTAISKLEHELNTALLIRGTRSFKLTPSGEVAYMHAKEVAVHAGNLSVKLAAVAGKKIAVKVGMIDSLADTLLAYHPGLYEPDQQASVSLVINNSRYLTAAIERDDIDVAFVVTQAHSPSNVTVVDIGAEPLLLVCHQALQRDVQQALNRKHISNFIGYDQSSTTLQLIQQAFHDHKITVQPSLYSTSPDVIRKLVLAQKGAAVLPYLMVRELLRDQQLVAIAIGNARIIERPIQAIRHRDKLLAPPLVQMIDELRDALGTLSTEVQFR